MTYSWDGKTLLGGSRGEERACSAEKDLLQFARIQFVQKITAQGNGTAAAAGAAGMDILFRVVENQCAAVGEFSAQRNTVF